MASRRGAFNASAGLAVVDFRPVPSGVLFDFNGVLVDDEHLHHAAFNEVLAPQGMQISEAEYLRDYLGLDDRGAFNAVLAAHGRPAPRKAIDEFIALKAAIYARRATTELRVFAGAAELLARVSHRCVVGIVSGALRSEIQGALTLLGVADRVAVVVAAEDVSACKPDPEGYLRAVALLRERDASVLASRVVAVEDSLAGIESARAAGLGVIGVAHTYPVAQLAAAGARPVRATIAEIIDADFREALSR